MRCMLLANTSSAGDPGDAAAAVAAATAAAAAAAIAAGGLPGISVELGPAMFRCCCCCCCCPCSISPGLLRAIAPIQAATSSAAADAASGPTWCCRMPPVRLRSAGLLGQLCAPAWSSAANMLGLLDRGVTGQLELAAAASAAASTPCLRLPSLLGLRDRCRKEKKP